MTSEHEPSSLEDAIAVSFPDVAQEVRAQMFQIWSLAMGQYQLHQDDSNSSAAAVARAGLFESGQWRMFLPLVFSEDLDELLVQVVEARNADNRDELIGALQEALAATPAKEAPLSAALRRELAEIYRDRYTRTQNPPDNELAWQNATRAASTLLSMPQLAEDQATAVLTLAGESCANRLRGERRQNQAAALHYHKTLVNLLESNAHANEARLAIARNNVGSLLLVSDSLDDVLQAKELFQYALHVYSTQLGAMHRLTISTAGNLVNTHRMLEEHGLEGELEEGIRLGEAYFTATETGDFDVEDARLVSALFAALANAYVVRTGGDHSSNADRAIELGEEALRLTEQAEGAISWNTIAVLRNLALIYHLGVDARHQDRIESAQGLLEEALRRARATFGEDPQQLSTLIDQLANVRASNARDTRELTNIADMHREALSVLEGAGDESGVCQDRMKIRFNLATTLAQVARSYGIPIQAPGEQLLREVEKDLIELLKDLEQQNWGVDLRIKASQEILTIRLELRIASGRKGLSDDIVLANQRLSQEQSSWTGAVATQLGSDRIRGYLFAKLGAWEEAAPCYERAARKGGAEVENATTLESRTRLLVQDGGDAIQAAWAFSQLGLLDRAARVLELSRGRWFKSRRRTFDKTVQEVSVAHPTLAAAYRDSVRELTVVENEELSYLSALGPRAASPPANSTDFDLAKRTGRARARMLNLIDEIRQIGYPEFAKEPDWSSVLGAGTSARPLVYVAVTHHGALALIVSGDEEPSSVVDELVRHDDLVRLLQGDDESGAQRERSGFIALMNGSTTDQANALSLAMGFCRELFNGIAHELKKRDARGLVLMGCGGIGILPLHLLGSEPLAHQFEVSFAPSGSALVDAPHGLALDPRALAYLGVAGSGLPAASAEILASSRLFGRAQVRSSSTPIPTIFKDFGSAQVIHVACHGEPGGMDPGGARILVTPNDSIHMRELMALDQLNNCLLVVASACSSAVGVRLPDESLHFCSGFLLAGATTVVGALWQVSDLATCLLVTKFFDELATTPREAIAALHDAQTWLRQASAHDLVAYANSVVGDRLSGGLVAERQQWNALIRTLDELPRDHIPFRDPLYWGGLVLYGAP